MLLPRSDLVARKRDILSPCAHHDHGMKAIFTLSKLCFGKTILPPCNNSIAGTKAAWPGNHTPAGSDIQTETDTTDRPTYRQTDRRTDALSAHPCTHSPGEVEVLLVQRARHLDGVTLAPHDTLREHERSLVRAHVLSRVPLLRSQAKTTRNKSGRISA